MLDKKSNVPLYIQLVQELKEEITQNLRVGDKLPTEKEMEKKYDVSRMTVRSAIDELQNQGIVSKIQGKGTFVKQNKLVQNLGTIFSWTEEMQLKNYSTETLEKKIHRIAPSKKIRKELMLTEGESVICVERVRTINDEPIVILVTYLREKYIPGFFEAGFAGESLYKVLESDYNIQLTVADEVISARNCTPIEAVRLNVEEDSAVLNVRRITYLETGAPFEVVDMIARGDKYHYLAHLEGRNIAKKG